MKLLNIINDLKAKNALLNEYEDISDILFNLLSEHINDINESELYDSIYEYDYIYSEIIYSSEAMKYLAEKDISLCESLEIANEYGYTLDSLNSGLLATLLGTRYAKEEAAENIAIILAEIAARLEAEAERLDYE